LSGGGKNVKFPKLPLYAGKNISFPSDVIYYVPVTIRNNQLIPTLKPFQELIQINCNTYKKYVRYNEDYANLEFFTSNGKILPAWIESDKSGYLLAWVRISKKIPAGKTLKIYLGFSSANTLSSSGNEGIGEAPQLSPEYGKYDDGAKVFNFYDNFAGYFLDSQFTNINNTPYGSSGGVSVHNGLTFAASGGAYTNHHVITASSNYNPNNNIFDWYGTPYKIVGHSAPGCDGVSVNNGGWGWAFNGNTGAVRPFYGTFTSVCPYANDINNFHLDGNGNFNVSAFYSPPSKGVYSTIIADNTLFSEENYGKLIFKEHSVNPPLMTNFGWGIGYASKTTSFNIIWARLRSTPPNNVMPDVSFGNIHRTN
jgi:hypothetical protein